MTVSSDLFWELVEEPFDEVPIIFHCPVETQFPGFHVGPVQRSDLRNKVIGENVLNTRNLRVSGISDDVEAHPLTSPGIRRSGLSEPYLVIASSYEIRINGAPDRSGKAEFPPAALAWPPRLGCALADISCTKTDLSPLGAPNGLVVFGLQRPILAKPQEKILDKVLHGSHDSLPCRECHF